MKRLLAILLVTALWAPSALAQRSKPVGQAYPLGVLLDGVALSASAASRTFSIPFTGARKGYDVLTAYIKLSHSAESSVTMSCTTTPNVAVGAATVQECTVASGVCTSADASWAKAVTGDATWPWRADISGFLGTFNCVVGGAVAGADTVTVYGWLVTTQ